MAIRGGSRPSTSHYILSCQYEQTVLFPGAGLCSNTDTSYFFAHHFLSLLA